MKDKDIKKRSSRRTLPPLKVMFIDPELKTEEDIKNYKERVSRMFEILFEDVMKARKMKNE